MLEDDFVSHLGGPNKQFGTHDKLSVGLERCLQGKLNWGGRLKFESLYFYRAQTLANRVCLMRPQFCCISSWPSLYFYVQFMGLDFTTALMSHDT